MMGGGNEGDLGGAGDGARLDFHLGFGRVIAIDELRVRAVLVGGPQAEEVPVEAVDVIPTGVEEAAIVGHTGSPLEVLKRGQRVDALAVGGHAVQREHRNRTEIIAPAADVAIGEVCGARRVGEPLAALDRGALAGGNKGQLAAGQVTGIKVVVFAVGELAALGAVDVHLKDVIEGVLRHARLVGLVRFIGQFRMEATVGEQHFLSIA